VNFETAGRVRQRGLGRPLDVEWNKLVTRSPQEGCAEMHILATMLVALTAFAVTSAQAAPIPSKAYPTGKSHETPAQNVHKSRQYDYLLTTNSGFRSYRVRKECGPIKDPALRGDCIASFNTYESR
jgi:hypothetical protein